MKYVQFIMMFGLVPVWMVSCHEHDNRLVVHNERYPLAFKTFLARTNEKELTRQTIFHYMQILCTQYPLYLEGDIRLLDIGCGDGSLSQSIIRDISSLRERRFAGITYTGIDSQEFFVHEAYRRMSELDITTATALGDANDDQLFHKVAYPANLVFASHIAYFFSDVDTFVHHLEAILPTGLALFVHCAGTPVDALIEKYAGVVRPQVTAIPTRLTEAFARGGFPCASVTFQPIVVFPDLTQAEWSLLQAIRSHQYSDDYTAWSSELQHAKHLIEFFLQDPLEAFTDEQRYLLLEDFKKLVTSYDNKLPLKNVLHVVVARDSDPEYIRAVMRSMHDLQQVSGKR